MLAVAVHQCTPPNWSYLDGIYTLRYKPRQKNVSRTVTRADRGGEQSTAHLAALYDELCMGRPHVFGGLVHIHALLSLDHRTSARRVARAVV